MGPVKVIAIRKTRKPGPLRGFSDVKMGAVLIQDFRIIETGGRLVVDSPQASWRDPATREIRFKSIVTLPPDLKQSVEIAVLHAWQEEMEKKENDGNSFQ
jgi:DNA-binding cell septation regulator SpoVG